MDDYVIITIDGNAEYSGEWYFPADYVQYLTKDGRLTVSSNTVYAYRTVGGTNFSRESLRFRFLLDPLYTPVNTGTYSVQIKITDYSASGNVLRYQPQFNLIFQLVVMFACVVAIFKRH